MLALPEPIRGGSVAELRPFANVKDESGWRLLLAVLVAVLRPTGPYPVLAEAGEQGSAKTTLGRLLRSITDPNKAPLRSEPRTSGILVIAASNGWLVALDNLSTVPPWLSDALCRLSTGGGFGTRQLYSDDEEKLFDACRPVLLTSIEDVVSRGDLFDRAVFLELDPIPKDRRKTEAALAAAWEPVRPRVLGTLLDAVSVGLRRLPDVRLPELPRMADFCLWAEACGPAFGWKPGAFARDYEANRAQVNESALEASIVYPVLRQALADAEDGTWSGTATQLHQWLTDTANERTRKAKAWPGGAKSMSNHLRRLGRTCAASVTASSSRGRKTRPARGPSL